MPQIGATDPIKDPIEESLKIGRRRNKKHATQETAQQYPTYTGAREGGGFDAGVTDLVKRAAALEPLVDIQPVVAGWLATNGRVNDDDTATLAEGIRRASAWLGEYDKMGGMPDALASMRLKAEDMDDPAMKAMARDIIEGIEDLSPQDQQLFMVWASGRAMQHEATAKAGAALAADLIEESTGVVETEAAGEGVFIRPPETQSSIDPAVETLAALRDLFPSVHARIKEDVASGAWEWFEEFFNEASSGMNGNPVAEYVWKKSRSARYLTEMVGSHIDEGKKFSIREAFNFAALTSFGPMFDVTTGALGSSARTLEEGLTGEAKWTDALGRGMANTEQKVFGSVLTPALAFGLDKNDPDYQEKLDTRMGIFGLLSFGTFRGFGALGRRLKTARRAVGGEIGAQTALDAAAPFQPRGGVPGPKGKGILGAPAEIAKMPLRAVSESINKAIAKFGQSPDQWWESGFLSKKGARLVKTFEAAKEAHPGNTQGQVGFVQQAYGASAMPTSLVKAVLAEGTPDGMRRAFVKKLNDPRTPMELLQLRKKALQGRLARNVEGKDTSHPEVQGLVNRLKGMIAELDISEEHKARLGEFAEIEAPDPKWKSHVKPWDEANSYVDDPTYYDELVNTIHAWDETRLADNPKFREWVQRSGKIREREGQIAMPGEIAEIATGGSGKPLRPHEMDNLPVEQWVEQHVAPENRVPGMVVETASTGLGDYTIILDKNLIPREFDTSHVLVAANENALQALAEEIAGSTDRGAYSFLPAKDAVQILGTEAIDAELEYMDIAIRKHLGLPEEGTLMESPIPPGSKARKEVYSGHQHVFGEWDYAELSDQSIRGRGFYFAEDPRIASTYAVGEAPGQQVIEGQVPNVRPAYLDIKNPYDSTQLLPKEEIRRILQAMKDDIQGGDPYESGKAWIIEWPEEGETGLPEFPESWFDAQELREHVEAYDEQLSEFPTDIAGNGGAAKIIRVKDDIVEFEILTDTGGHKINGKAPKAEFEAAFEPGRFADWVDDAVGIMERDFEGREFVPGAWLFDTILDYGDVSRALEKAGYDGVFHRGRRDGNVWVAFRPEQIHPSPVARSLAAERSRPGTTRPTGVPDHPDAEFVSMRWLKDNIAESRDLQKGRQDIQGGARAPTPEEAARQVVGTGSLEALDAGDEATFIARHLKDKWDMDTQEGAEAFDAAVREELPELVEEVREAIDDPLDEDALAEQVGIWTENMMMNYESARRIFEAGPVESVWPIDHRDIAFPRGKPMPADDARLWKAKLAKAVKEGRASFDEEQKVWWWDEPDGTRIFVNTYLYNPDFFASLRGTGWATAFDLPPIPEDMAPVPETVGVLEVRPDGTLHLAWEQGTRDIASHVSPLAVAWNRVGPPEGARPEAPPAIGGQEVITAANQTIGELSTNVQEGAVYHVTSSENFANIRREGLTLDPEGEPTYFSDSPEGSAALMGRDVAESDWVILRRKRRDDLQFNDEEPGEMVLEDGTEPGEFYTDQADIPPSELEYFGSDNQWHPLVPEGAAPPAVARPARYRDVKDVADNDPSATGEDYAYHLTSEKNFESIQREGLKPKPDPLNEGITNMEGEEAVFFSSSPGRAHEISEQVQETNIEPIVLRRKAEGLTESDYGGDDWMQELHTSRRVPPEELEYLGVDQQWHPLVAPEAPSQPPRLRDRPDLFKSIKREGVKEPIQIQKTGKGKWYIADGNKRFAAAEELGIEELPTTVLDFTVPERLEPGVTVEARTLPPSRESIPVRQEQVVDLVPEEARVHADMESAKAEADMIQLELDAVDSQIKHWWDDRPMFQYPKRNAIRAGVRQAAGTRVEKFISYLSARSDGVPRGFDPAKFTNELPRYPKLYVRGVAGNPPNSPQLNAETLGNYMREAKVPARKIQQRIGELLETKSQREFFELVEHKIFGEGGDIDLALRDRWGPAVNPDIRRRLITLHDTNIESRTDSWISDVLETPRGGMRRVTRPVLGREVRPGEMRPSPASPSEFLHEIALPDVQLLKEANSLLSRIDKFVHTKSKAGGLVSQLVYRVPQFVLDATTDILKPLVLVVRIPPLIIRIQMEQALRMGTFGYRPFKGIPKGLTIFPGGIPIPFKSGKRVAQGVFGPDGWKMLAPDNEMAKIAQPDATEAGMIMSEWLDDGPTYRNTEDTLDFRTGRREMKTEHLEARRTSLLKAHDDMLLRQIVKEGFSEAKVLKWLDEDPRAQRYMRDNQQPVLDELGVSRQDWIHDQVTRMKQLTLENPFFVEAVRTGKLRGPNDDPGMTGAKMPDGRNAADVWEDLGTEVTMLSQEIRHRYAQGFPEGEGPGYDPALNNAEIAAMQVVRQRKMAQMAALRDEYGTRVLGRNGVKLEDARKARHVIEEHWRSAEWELPEILTVEKRVRSNHYEGGVLDDWRRASMAISSALYRPFRALSWADTKGTRGSLFTQVYQRNLAELKARGYGPKEAAAWARAMAGETTRDLMYDLSARTSAQRAMRNFFWFGPAYQEVMYTWLVKAPSASYWPIGAVSLTGQFMVARKMLREIGVIQEDSRGEEIIVLPGFGKVVEALTGSKVPDLVFGKLSGLNLITSGGGIPGLTSPINFALGKAALKWGGPFKALSDALQPYGPEQTILPQPITHLWEAVTGEPPPFELLAPEYLKSQWDRSQDYGIQYAYAELQEKGVVPPRPEEYGTKEEDGTWILTQDQEQAYKEASTEYLSKLLDLGKEYATGIAWTRFAGSAITPMSLSVTSTEREEWTKFWESVVAPAGYGPEGLSNAQRELIDAHLENNPESFAYSVFYSEYGPKTKSLPFKEDLDDEFYDEYYTGEKKVMEPRDFSQKLMAIESLRHYQNRTSVILDEISPNRDPWELLRNGYARQGAIQAEREAWDRWMTLNPEAQAVLLKSRKFWADSNRVPTQSFESERIGRTISALRQLSPQISGSAAYRTDEVRKVLGDLQELYSEHSEEFGAPNTKAEKAMDWWFDNVLDPYFAETDALYQQAQDLEARGLSPSPVYDQIRQIQNRPPPQYKGQPVPSVEEVFFGNRTPPEQEEQVMKWQTRPLTWLSDFQLDKAWPGTPEVVKSFLEQAAAFDQSFWEFVRERDVAPGSDEYEDLQVARENQLRQAAQQAGPEALAAFELNEQAPAIRLVRAGYGSSSQPFLQTVQAAGAVASQLEAEEYSPKGFSESATQYKGQLYSAIEQARSGDTAYDELWIRLSNIMPLPSGVNREGAALYEAVLFGNFNTQFIPYEIAAIGG